VNRYPSSYLSPKLEGRAIDDKGGKGLFARECIRPGELLVVWGGRVVSGRHVQDLEPFRRRLILQVEEDLYLLSTVESAGDWVNHSCAPNAGLEGQILLVAMRSIRPNQEICYDYAMSESNEFEEFDCGCGSAQCRGTLSRTDWQLPELWDRYDGHFSPYLERRIRALRSAVPA
jgi:hypothetical protein